ncbi:MAG: VCBS repeat-containing protein, partial [Planctomycetes bacterium]|nr:VCBS repeat-containing protein [Planctomycetota bacterium]
MTRSSCLFLVVLLTTSGDALWAGNLFFKRGDANLDGKLDLSDATYTLRFLFFGRPESLDCQDAADSNDDGALDISDPVRSLGFLFLGTVPLPPPFEECALDPSRDALGCAAFPGCEQAPPAGEGIFGEPVNYAAHCLPTAAALADFNGDHALDLVYTNWCSGVSIRPGAGDGTFGEAVNYSLATSLEIGHRTGFRPEAVAIGDVNADGVVDLAAVSSDSSPVSDLSILLGAGDGSFGEVTSYPLNGRGAHSVALGDLDQDGALDVVSGL